MSQISLNGPYKLKRFCHGQSLRPVFAEDFFPEGWFDTWAPEDVRTVLRREGLITGYYYGKGLDAERWIEESDWVYTRNFWAEPAWEGCRNILRFEGIDTLAEVWLNGELLGCCKNMFLPHCFDVGARLRYGAANRLAVRILSPVRELEGVGREGLYPADDTDRLLLRKSQMNFGWDFCGHCLTSGLWKEVWLDSLDDDRLTDVFLYTDRVENGEATIGFSVEAEAFAKNDLNADSVEIRFARNGREAARLRLPWQKAQKGGKLTIPNPALWWPRPYGDPNLYEVSVTLSRKGRELDRRDLRFGIRTLRLLQEKLPEGGRSFIFEVNGRRIFVRGANWVPLNCIYAEIRAKDYDFYIRRALESNLTMLRVWGGGIYESEHFFDLCDENGLLVLQDFMLACGILPQDEDFLRQVHDEAAAITRQYRNRACLALWSADNELDQAYWWYDLQAIFKSNRVNRVAVRSAVAQNDPTRPFLVSSPCSPFDDEAGNEDPNSPLQGDMHLYLTRFNRESEYYYKKLLECEPRFMSEYGFSSLPVRDTFDKFNFFARPLDLAKNPWLGHLPQLKTMGEAGETEKLLYFTQYTHAQALKYWIEYLRSCKWICGGSLYWKFNDPIAPNRPNMLFPTLMSSIDFYRNPKLAYYYARRAYEDVILAFREDLQGGLDLYSCNETQNKYAGQLEVCLLRWNGEKLAQLKSAVVLPGDASCLLLQLPIAQWRRHPAQECYIRAEFRGEGLSLVNRYLLTEIGDWLNVQPEETALHPVLADFTETSFTVRLASSRYAQDVMLTILDTDVCYSDNAFCMDAGERREVRITSPNGFQNQTLQIKAANAKPVVLNLPV